ncbi:MAG TPA: hypothetical protein VE710_18395 [Candidatus Bathyarchaeia archaeon]|nr:hypothetical protein [Candidatus Bathyarchaeia archaeon]
MSEKEVAQKEPTFTKAQFLSSKQFTPMEKDFLRTVLEDGKTYTLAQARKELEKALAREVK